MIKYCEELVKLKSWRLVMENKEPLTNVEEENDSSIKQIWAEKKGLIIAAACVLLIIIGFFLYRNMTQANRDVEQAEAYVAAEQYAQALQVYDMLLSKEQKADWQKRRDEIQLIIDSEASYEAGIRAYNENDYQVAFEAFAKVTEADQEKFEDAQVKRQEIVQALIEKVQAEIKKGNHENAQSLLEGYQLWVGENEALAKVKEEITSEKTKLEEAKAKEKQEADFGKRILGRWVLGNDEQYWVEINDGKIYLGEGEAWMEHSDYTIKEIKAEEGIILLETTNIVMEGTDEEPEKSCNIRLILNSESMVYENHYDIPAKKTTTVWVRPKIESKE